jgi:methylmalonyl-CoA mutase cobalamin-binding domain/chain
MTPTSGILQSLETAVLQQDGALLDQAMNSALDHRLPGERIRQALLDGLDKIRRRLLSNDASLPELLVSLDIVASGLEKLKAVPFGMQEGDPVSLVIGVVPGDPHDLGKNIIAMIYRSFGYQVWDLGAGVPLEAFVNTVLEKKAKFLALSAMMSTTMTKMPDIIKAVKSVSPDTLVLVGGAPLDQTLARLYGADGFAESAATVIEETGRLLKQNGTQTPCSSMKRR